MWLASLLLLSCARREPDAAAQLAAALRSADRAWDDRATSGLDAVGGPLLEAWRLAPADPEVGWRMVRWRVALGLASGDPREAREAWAAAREQGTACLDADPLFQARRQASGWADALQVLPDERASCAAWLGMAWTRWIAALGGEAASLDLQDVDAILGAATDHGATDVAGWALGLLSAVRPTWAGRDQGRAVRELRAAVDRDPGSVVRQADLYTWGLVPAGEVAQAEALRARILATQDGPPEDRAARERLAAEPAPVPGG